MADETLDRIARIRDQVLDLHKMLVDAEREAWERVHGQTPPAAFLRVVIEDEAFAWLRPLTAWIVRIDEWAAEDERRPEVAAAAVDELARLLAPEPALQAFHTRYAVLLQERPEIVLAHRAVTRAIDAARV